MDSDSQSDKPPQGGQQGNFSEFTNVVGMIIALITLATPIISIILFSAPSTSYEPLASGQKTGVYSSQASGSLNLH